MSEFDGVYRYMSYWWLPYYLDQGWTIAAIDLRGTLIKAPI